MTHEDVVAAARCWIGTPYVHQFSKRGVGTDCLGLIRGIWREIYGAEPETAPPYTPDWGEIGGRELLLQGAMRHLCPISSQVKEVPGEVLLFRMRRDAIAKHVGIRAGVGANPSFIHAYDGHGVVESPLSAPWQQRIVARFIYPIP